MSEDNEWLADPPQETSSLSNIDHVNIHVTISMIHDVLTAMLEDAGDTSNIASVYEPFQVLLRQVFTAAERYYSDHGSQELARITRDLLDSGKLDSPSVARAPSAKEVADIINRLTDGNPLDSERDHLQFRDEVQRVVADAMDCACKQAIAAPQTVGSRFARPESDSMRLSPREVARLEQALDAETEPG